MFGPFEGKKKRSRIPIYYSVFPFWRFLLQLFDVFLDKTSGKSPPLNNNHQVDHRKKVRCFSPFETYLGMESESQHIGVKQLI